MSDSSTRSVPRAPRIAFLTWGITCYAVFFACFLYAIAFLGDFAIALLSLFAVQHSGMARPAFKRAWTKIVPEAVERPTYVLASTLVLVALFAFWQPIGGTIWAVTSDSGALAIRALYFGGWLMLLYATALIDHFDLFGLRQAWFGFRGEPYTHRPFATPGMYAHVRHPLYVSWAIIFWSAPVMSAGHLLFAIVATAYMVVAVFFEERDLVGHFGDAYRRYQETTPKYFPRFARAKRTVPAPPRAA